MRERGELRTRAFEVTLRRSRFLLPTAAEDDDEERDELAALNPVTHSAYPPRVTVLIPP